MNIWTRICFIICVVIFICLAYQIHQVNKMATETHLDLVSHECSHPLFSQISENKCTRCGSNFMVAGVMRSVNTAWFYCGDCGYRFCDMKFNEFLTGPNRDKVFLKPVKSGDK